MQLRELTGDGQTGEPQQKIDILSYSLQRNVYRASVWNVIQLKS